MPPRILITDGDPTLCHVYQGFLARHGYEADTADSGLECLEQLRQQTPEVLVLDRELLWGGADGVLAWLRAERPTSRVAVILTATGGYTLDLAEELEPPVVGFVLKPFTLQALLEQVRSALTGPREAVGTASDSPGFPECFVIG